MINATKKAYSTISVGSLSGDQASSRLTTDGHSSPLIKTKLRQLPAGGVIDRNRRGLISAY